MAFQNRFSMTVLPLLALTLLPGCLTPSMGRKASSGLGGVQPRSPISIREVGTSRLVGRNFDGTPTEPSFAADEAARTAPPERAPLRP
jgi:hypothetical protein